MEEKTGYATITYQVRIYCGHLDWVELTVDHYNRILSFYYKILSDRKELLELSNQKLMRQLEIVTIGEKRSGKPAEIPLPFEKVPLYFRRSAINAAIRMVRSYISQHEKWKEKKGKGEPGLAEKFQVSPVYYKGMYRNFTEKDIELKLFNGTDWIWICCAYDNRKWHWEKDKEILSPTLKVTKKRIMLHVPVTEPVEDIRTLKMRLREENRICAVAFPNKEYLAVPVILDMQGKYLDSVFIKGGNELLQKRKYLLGKIDKCRISMKDTSKSLQAYPAYQKKLTDLSEQYAHQISRQILNYCLENKVKIIVVPSYGDPIPFPSMAYLKTSSYDWIGRRIISYLRYKAFREGVLVTAVNPAHISDRCYICGAQLNKYNEGYAPNPNFYGGKHYICKNGHKGNSSFNTAMNVGNTFLAKYK